MKEDQFELIYRALLGAQFVAGDAARGSLCGTTDWYARQKEQIDAAIPALLRLWFRSPSTPERAA